MKIVESIRKFGLALTLAPLTAAAGLDTQCFSETSNRSSDWAYCIHKTEGSRSEDVLYYMHGILGDQESWVAGKNAELRADIRSRWESMGENAPTVVTISLGGKWLLNDELYELFNRVLIPQVEGRLGHPPGERMIMGVSMGGFNTLQAILRSPQSWDKAVLISPLIPLCDPFLDQRSLYFCIAADPHRNNVYAAYQSHMMVKEFFPRKRKWLDRDPIALAKQVMNREGFPKLLVTTGTADEFAFFTPSKKLASIAKERDVNTTWIPTSLEHGYFDPNAIADFLAE